MMLITDDYCIIDVLQRGRVELLGPTALRERLASEYKIQLTTHEITLLMKKFDVEDRGLVNIGTHLQEISGIT